MCNSSAQCGKILQNFIQKNNRNCKRKNEFFSWFSDFKNLPM